MQSKRISRKEFLGIGAGAAAGFALAGSGTATFFSKRAAAAAAFRPFRTQLPTPPKITPALGDDNAYRVSLVAKPGIANMHPQLSAVNVWGYRPASMDGGYLGPTIEVGNAPGTKTVVEFTNGLPSKHLLSASQTPGLDGGRGTDTRILTHLHGGFVSGDNDGNPYASGAPGDPGSTETAVGETKSVEYPAQPRATTLWYHDHALGMTRLNVYAGLAAFFLVRDENDTGYESGPEKNTIGIPGGDYEIPIVIQDKSFVGGQLFYSPNDTWIPEFFGDTPVLNGVVQPFKNVEPRMYRLRFLNGSQSRFYNLEMAIGAASGGPFYQIGAEGGMFENTVQTNRILLLPGERADVIVDFSKFAGQNIDLKNRALPKGVVSPATPTIPSLMQFRVGTSVTTQGPTTIPTTLAGGSEPDLPAPDLSNFPERKRYITLEELMGPAGPIQLQLNGQMFHEEVDEKPVAGTVEDWYFVNISADTHPMHMHLTNFQVMGRRAIDGAAYFQDLANARALAAGNPKAFPLRPDPPPLLGNNTLDPTPYYIPRSTWVAPRANERGWKDTVGADPNQVTWIRQKFDLPSEVTGTQKYVYHCHILEHEENDMMRPFEVTS